MAEAPTKRRWTRRRAMIGGGAAVVGAAAVLAARKSDLGGAHNRYFQGLSRALKRARIGHPVLIVDRTRLDLNIAAARTALQQGRLPLRIVVKSLPIPAILERVATGMATHRYMVFNGPMLSELAKQPGADLLLGKPLAAVEFANIVDLIGAPAASRIQWLIDTPMRLRQYAEIAGARGVALRTNMEIDVGLHRGGFPDARLLAAAVQLAKTFPHVEVSGLMGYDVHVSKVGDFEAAYQESQDRYRNAIEVLRAAGRQDAASLTLNAAGSPTFMRHARGTVANEVSVGSAFVKPHDFEVETLTHYVPAAFIATPVLKAQPMQVPGYEWLAGPVKFMDPNAARGFFIHGGHWLATPASPPGLEYSSLWGHSSNQEMLNGSNSMTLAPDDYVFLRPNQSEALFLQFGDIAVYDGDTIAERWPTFPVSA